MKSMTGFGRAEVAVGSYHFGIEIKTVNHRYLDLGIKIPRKIGFLEEGFREQIKKRIRRGRVDLYVNISEGSDAQREVVLNESLCRSYVDSFAGLGQKMGVENDLTLSVLARLPDVIQLEQADLDENEIKEEMQKGFNTAMDQLISMREIEGAALRLDMHEKIGALHNMIDEITSSGTDVQDVYRNKLLKRVREMIGNEIHIDETRIMMEIAIFAEKSSIDEEVVRFKSHLSQFREGLKSNEPAGRKLDFLVQELNREINTIGSKTSDLDVSSLIIHVKSELEKVREQVQNIE